MLNFGNIINTLDGIVGWIDSTTETISDIFHDVGFSILYDWLPNDIQSVITAVIAILLFLALFGILRRLLFFLG